MMFTDGAAPLINSFSSLWRYRALVLELTKRDFIGKYRGSFVGVFWSLLQPIFMLSIYTIAFGVILKSRWSFSGGTAEYALMLFAGLIIVNTFAEVLRNSSTIISRQPHLVKKVRFPVGLLPIVVVTSSLLNIAPSVLVWICGYSVIFGPPAPALMLLPLVFICYVPILLAASWFLSSLGVFIKDLEHITGTASHVLLFLTPVFYGIEAAPVFLRKILLLNPLTYLVEQFRLIAYFGEVPAFRGLVVYLLIGSIFASIGLIVFKRLRPRFADII